MTWKILKTKRLHEGDVLSLDCAELELNDGTKVDSHYIVRVPLQVVSLVLRDDSGRILLLRRHRFIIDRWCWDVPAGKIADGESVREAAQRAAIEETGWRARAVREIAAYHPNPGMSDQKFRVCVGDGAERVGDWNPNEVDALEWVSPGEALARIRAGEIDGLSLTSLLMTFVSARDP